MRQHGVCKASWGPPHSRHNVGDRGAGGQATVASNGQGRQGRLTKERRWAGRAPKISGTGHQVKETTQQVG